MARSRTFALGPFDLAIEAEDAAALSRWNALFDGFPAPPAATADSGSHQSIVLRVSSSEGRHRAWLDDELVGDAAQQRELELIITRVVNRRVLDNEPGRLHLHGGAVHRSGQTVLVVGASMAGKSTLVAKLVTDGWSYLSDEQLGVTLSGELVSYPRSLTLRADSYRFFPDQIETPAEDADRIELPPRSLGAVYAGPAVAPSLIVQPNVATQESTVERLSVAAALAMLVTDTLDMERAGSKGLEGLLSLVTNAPAYRVNGRDLDASLRTIGELTLAAIAPGQPVEAHEVVTDTGLQRAGSIGWLFPDGSAAVLHSPSGVLVELDEVGYRYWRSLADGMPDTRTEAADAFIADLVDLELLRVETTPH